MLGCMYNYHGNLTMPMMWSKVFTSSGVRGLEREVRHTPRFDAAAFMRLSDSSPSWYAQPPSLYLHGVYSSPRACMQRGSGRLQQGPGHQALCARGSQHATGDMLNHLPLRVPATGAARVNQEALRLACPFHHSSEHCFGGWAPADVA